MGLKPASLCLKPRHKGQLLADLSSHRQVGLRASLATVTGRGNDEEAKDHCVAAAFGPWLAESLKCFHEWMDTKMDKQLHAKVR